MSVMKVVYLVNKYSVLIDIALLMLGMAFGTSSHQSSNDHQIVDFTSRSPNVSDDSSRIDDVQCILKTAYP